jgi:hypothetical protein
MATTRVFISDALILSTTRRPNGSAGTWKFVEKLILKTMEKAVAGSPIGNPMDRMHDGRPVGCYAGGFRTDHMGTNQFALRGAVYNDCPHAIYVERGRRATNEPSYFTSDARAGKSVYSKKGTRAHRGFHVLEDAFERVILTTPGLYSTGVSAERVGF